MIRVTHVPAVDPEECSRGYYILNDTLGDEI